jgi:hypothetical protein
MNRVRDYGMDAFATTINPIDGHIHVTANDIGTFLIHLYTFKTPINIAINLYNKFI